jgi:hypothetical protein
MSVFTGLSRLAILSGILCALGQNVAANSSNPAVKQVMQQELSGIIHQAAKEATIKTRDGTTFTTMPLISSEDLEKVRRFGNEAIPLSVSDKVCIKSHYD